MVCIEWNFVNFTTNITCLYLTRSLPLPKQDFIWNKIKASPEFHSLNMGYKKDPVGDIILKTLAFTYLNPHVYSDTIFIIGGFSREFILNEKIAFVIGASLSSFIYFFSLGYAASYFTNFINNQSSWRLINRTVIATMFVLSTYVCYKIILLFSEII